MFAKSSLFVFLAIALSATSALASAGAGPNESAQVGRRFESESDTSDYVSGSKSEELPYCTSKVINVRGVKKVLRDNSHHCQKDAQEAAADRQPEDDFGEENNDIGSIPDGVIGDNGAADEEDADARRPLLDVSDNEEVEEEEEQDEVDEADVGSGKEDEGNRYAGGYDDESEDEDEGAYAGQGHDQNI